jgi:FixJ family two-component response regulator
MAAARASRGEGEDSTFEHDVLAPQALTENGGSAFIEKPFNARKLLGAVSDLLERPARRRG